MDQEQAYAFSARDENNDSRYDPVCTDITHFKRVGVGCSYEFLCTFKAEGGSRQFWVQYTQLAFFLLAQRLGRALQEGVVDP